MRVLFAVMMQRAVQTGVASIGDFAVMLWPKRGEGEPPAA